MITITKNKYLYYAKGDDAFVLSAITGIAIKSGACMFSQEHLGTIRDALNSIGIPYCIKEDEIKVIEQGNNEWYRYLLEIGKISNKVQKLIKEENSRIRRKLKYINQL